MAAAKSSSSSTAQALDHPAPQIAGSSSRVDRAFGLDATSDRPVFCDTCCREHRIISRNVSESCDAAALADDGDDSESTAAAAGEVSSRGSSSGGGLPNPKVLRTFANDPPIPWSTFTRLRKSWGQPPSLSPPQETSVLKAIQKVKQQKVGTMSDSLPFVSVFINSVCPELKAPRDGATFLILAVVTGHMEILNQCLELGASPNDVRFLGSQVVAPNCLRHGFSPFFLACICEQIEVMESLYAKGASLHVMDRWGRTPLHAAAALGNAEVVRWLLDRGAPQSVTDRDLLRAGEVCPGRVRLGTVEPSHPFLSRRGGAGGAGSHGGGRLATCVCGSGRPRGECCCVDDMRQRWYLDRVASEWLPMEFIDAMSQTQVLVDSRVAAAATSRSPAL